MKKGDRAMKKEWVPEGDYRNWSVIQSWANDMVEPLIQS
jgi:hypothetical protein